MNQGFCLNCTRTPHGNSWKVELQVCFGKNKTKNPKTWNPYFSYYISSRNVLKIPCEHRFQKLFARKNFVSFNSICHKFLKDLTLQSSLAFSLVDSVSCIPSLASCHDKIAVQRSPSQGLFPEEPRARTSVPNCKVSPQVHFPWVHHQHSWFAIIFF